MYLRFFKGKFERLNLGFLTFVRFKTFNLKFEFFHDVLNWTLKLELLYLFCTFTLIYTQLKSCVALFIFGLKFVFQT